MSKLWLNFQQNVMLWMKLFLKGLKAILLKLGITVYWMPNYMSTYYTDIHYIYKNYTKKRWT